MKLFIFVIVAMMLSGIAMAAEVPTSEGDKALVFMFNGFDHLSFGGYGGEYGIGLRYYIADGTAIRGGLQVANNSTTLEDSDPDAEMTTTMYGLNVVYEKHLEAPCSSVSPYFGVGGAYALTNTEYTNWPVWDDYYWELDTRDEETDKGTVFGLFGVLGFEWAFTNCMTLGGEYQLGYWSHSCATEHDEGDDTGVEAATWMGFDTASVFLSVYF